MDDEESTSRLPRKVYESRTIRRNLPVAYYTTQTRQRIEARMEWWWLMRRWATDGAGRPLVIRHVHDQLHLYVIENKAAAALREPPVSQPNPYLYAYQINQQTGQWTHTRSRACYERSIVEVLPVTHPLVQKARVWACRQRLTRSGGG